MTDSKTMIRNRATTPYSRCERKRSPLSSLGSSASSPTQQYCQPRSFHYPESYGGAGFWQPPLSIPQPGEHLYASQYQNSQGLNPFRYQPAAVGTGLCETSQASPVPYYGAEVERQPPPSVGNFCTPSSSYTPWSAMENSHAMGNY